MKRNLVLFTSLAVSLSMLFAGCSKSGDTAASGKDVQPSASIQSEAGTLPIVKEKTTLKVLTRQKTEVKDYENNALTKYLEEKTNVKVDLQLIPTKDAANKINIMLASNSDLPDVFLSAGITNEMLVTYGSQGVFLPLNDLIKKYGVETKKVFSQVPDIEKVITAPDGKIYALPGYTDVFGNTLPQRFWINKVWLDKLGLALPRTTDEFYNVLKAFKTKDPNGNGKADEIPLMGSTNGWHNGIDGFLMNAFIYNDGGNRLALVNGKVDSVFDKPQWRKGLEFLNKLCKEGLLDPTSFTSDSNQQKQIFESPDAAKIGALPSGGPHIFANPTGERRKEYTVLPPLKGPDGNQSTLYNPYVAISNGTFVITKSCKNPDIAMRWADFQYTEDVSTRSRYGVPDVDWKKAQAGEMGVNGKPAFYIDILKWGQVQSSHWQQANLSYLPERIASTSSVWNKDPYELEYWLYNSAKAFEPYKPKEVLPPLIMSEKENEQYTQYKTTINTYVAENIARFITGNRSIEKDWDAYVNELNKMGLKDYVKMTQEAYERQYGKK